MAISQKRWVGAVIVIAVVVLVLVGLANRRQPPEVQTAFVAREDLESGISSNGKVEPIKPYVVRAELATFVEKVLAVEGQPVHRGQLLLVLNADDARARLAQAREALLTAQEDLRAAKAGGVASEAAQLDGDLRKAEAEVKSLAAAQETLQKLVAKQAATQGELDQNKLALARAQSELQTLRQKKAAMERLAAVDVERASFRAQQASADIHSLEEKVRASEVTAPLDGTLFSLPVHAGDYVKVGELLAEMADLVEVRVRAFVDEPDLGTLAVNQPVVVTWDAIPSHVWTGRTEVIPKQVVARGTRSVGEVLCSVDNSKLELLPNVNVNVLIRVRQKAGVLVVPRAAIRSDGTHRYAFLFQDGRIHKREIAVGIASATKYEVVSGLAEGDRVALLGDRELKDGLEVRALEPK